MSDIEPFLLLPGSTIRQAAECINRNRSGISLVVDADRRICGTITDGDIRRAVLAGISLDESIDSLLACKPTAYRQPTTARIGTPRSEIVRVMQDASIRHLPLVDEGDRVVDIALLDDLAPRPTLPLEAVIMAGGFGKRLGPLTQETPKPMLPVGDRPLLELTIERLRQAGIRRVNVTTHYLADEDHGPFR